MHVCVCAVSVTSYHVHSTCSSVLSIICKRELFISYFIPITLLQLIVVIPDFISFLEKVPQRLNIKLSISQYLSSVYSAIILSNSMQAAPLVISFSIHFAELENKFILKVP